MTVGARSLVFATQLWDPDDPVLGFTPGLVDALAAPFDRVVVVANEVRGTPSDLPRNVQVVSLGKERGAGRWTRGARFEAVFWRIARRERPDAILAHMCPEYLVLAAPIARLSRIPTLLWFAHPSDGPKLARADGLADAVLTSVPGAYPRPGPKVRAIGQAIDLDAFGFTPAPVRSAGDPFELLALGRTSDSKRYDLALCGVAAARERGVNARLRIVGPSGTDRERRIRADLRELAGRLRLGEAASVEDGVPHRAVPGLLGAADALLNTTVDGSGDKTVLEAMAVGRATLVTNLAFGELLGGTGLLVPGGDADALAAAIEVLATSAEEQRESLGRDLRARVERGHSIEHWAAAVAAVVEEVCA